MTSYKWSIGHEQWEKNYKNSKFYKFHQNVRIGIYSLKRTQNSLKRKKINNLLKKIDIPNLRTLDI